MARTAALVPRRRMRRVMQSLVVIATVACLPAVSYRTSAARSLRITRLKTHSSALQAKSATGL